MSDVLQQSLQLPCGAVLPNRLAKAAMTEGLADTRGIATPELQRLYGIWSDGGAGLLLSGNIQVDSKHLERPGNVIVQGQPEPERQAALSALATAATRNGNHFWAQISHAGRQTPKAVNPNPKAPSAVKVGLPGGQFGEPVPLTVAEIETLIERFAECAVAVQQAGFTGVQVHAAHGYLMSEFLSPKTNLREDEYGGSLENRARALLSIVKRTRAAVGPGFPLAVKLNSADFQKGGFAFEDSLQVAQWLQEAGVDLIEISGGTYEQPKLMGLAGLEAEEPQNVAQSTLQREAYFVDFALAMQEVVSVPLMVTGGFRTRSAMEQAITSGAADVIGLGRPLCVDTDAPQQLVNGLDELTRYENIMHLLPDWLRFLERIPALRGAAGFSQQYWYYAQLLALGRQGQPDRQLSVFQAAKQLLKHEKEWLAGYQPPG
ncbi:MAG: NADH:flavin oxidoreductase/NADH oxidase family protein [Gammaproteobacteria bacterium]|nr:NADH:flavin oxidoreductase/NADH oxidase family protein [Gammaproteobacteria bacterium]